MGEEVDDRSSASRTPLPPEQRAINLAQTAETGMSDANIKSRLQAKKGILKVYGWNARKTDDQIYTVAYTYAEGPSANIGAWAFEVDLKAEVVRPIIGDAELGKKYSDWTENLTKKN